MIKKYITIKNGKIDNIILAESSWLDANGFTYHEYEDAKHHFADLGDDWDVSLTYAEKQPDTQAMLNTLPSISAYQLRLQLTKMGIRQDVEAAISQASQDIQDGYQYASTYAYTDPLVQMFIQGFGLSDSDVIQLFTEASQIV